MTSRSVAQIAVASMRTSTSAVPGRGTGLSTSVNSPGLPRIHAFIVFTFFPGYIILYIILASRNTRGLPEGGSDETRAIGPSDRRDAGAATPCLRAGCNAQWNHQGQHRRRSS